jgi:hypothetical protein
MIRLHYFIYVLLRRNEKDYCNLLYRYNGIKLFIYFYNLEIKTKISFIK